MPLPGVPAIERIDAAEQHAALVIFDQARTAVVRLATELRRCHVNKVTVVPAQQGTARQQPHCAIARHQHAQPAITHLDAGRRWPALEMFIGPPAQPVATADPHRSVRRDGQRAVQRQRALGHRKRVQRQLHRRWADSQPAVGRPLNTVDASTAGTGVQGCEQQASIRQQGHWLKGHRPQHRA